MDNFLEFLGAFYLIPSLIIGGIGFLLGWFLKPSKKQSGDLSIEGEGALRAEADSLRTRVQDLEGRLSSRDTEVSDLKTSLASASAAPVASDASITEKTTDSDDTYALEWQNRYLAARVKYLDSRLAELGDADATSAPKKAATKKTAAKKKAPAKKAAPKKATAKSATKTKAIVAKPKTRAVTKTATAKKAPAKKAPAKKAAPKTAVAKKAPANKKAPAKKAPAKVATAKSPNEKHYDAVRKFDARASKSVIDEIVKYCGISLQSRDGSLVACSDESELETIAKGFATKKLGLTDGQMELAKSVCEQMKGTRMKSRVAFYYLMAKKAKKISVFK